MFTGARMTLFQHPEFKFNFLANRLDYKFRIHGYNYLQSDNTKFKSVWRQNCN